ncbi:signal peptidase I [Arthrobacter sp. NEB 688]|uniref:signal peptidase I n=1 Tax=Arthrobacter sp. NEB 688 TaxID=904039 RepID=UPI0015639D32|nr:signal peptidase I [Arthrobacter sp. NEB 688]QKE85064.1 signal peptidase I [Arthrobacter sp. NEB 688]
MALAVLLLTALPLWGGMRLFVVSSPSMGAAAPVGTLVVTRPAGTASVQRGDVVAFSPKDGSGLTVVHRVVAVEPSGSGRTLVTRGDLNGSDDPHPVTDERLVGRAVALLPGWGYAVRAVPLLGVGGLLVLLLTRLWLRPEVRGPVRLVAWSLLYAVTVLRLRPFVGVTELAVSSPTGTGAGGSRVSFVSTGMLPVTVTEHLGRAVSGPSHLSYGERGELVVRAAGAGGHVRLHARPDLGWTAWLLLWALCLLPVLWTLLAGHRRAAGERPARAAVLRAAHPVTG